MPTYLAPIWITQHKYVQKDEVQEVIFFVTTHYRREMKLYLKILF